MWPLIQLIIQPPYDAPSADTRGIEPRVVRQRIIETFHQVFKRFAAPIARDRVGECLPEAGRAVKVDRNDGIARSGEGLRIPAVMKMVFDCTLRSAMNHECDGILLAFLEADWLENPSLHFFATGAGEMKLVRLADAGQLHRDIVEVRELLGLRTIELRREEFSRSSQRILGKDNAVRPPR